MDKRMDSSPSHPFPAPIPTPAAQRALGALGEKHAAPPGGLLPAAVMAVARLAGLAASKLTGTATSRDIGGGEGSGGGLAASKLAGTAMSLVAGVAAVMAATVMTASAQDLPSLGDPASGTVSIDREYALGQEFMRNLRRSAPSVPDALLNSYLENLTYRLAAHSQLPDHRLSFIIIDNDELNAFAAPGGVIGVNTGLFIHAQTEGEFASVIAHEIAHVSQRHFARGIDEARAARIPQLATLLASVLVMATSDPAHGQAALMAAQGRALENQLRFSRSNEAEADRVGQDTMHAAGFDPAAMAGMFERLMARHRFGTTPPEFLLSHPLSETRVSEARSRASRYPLRDYSESAEYLINRTRVLSHYAEDKKALIIAAEAKFDPGGQGDGSAVTAANRYALAIAHYEAKNYADATAALAPLLAKEPNRISYAVTQGEIFTAQGEAGKAVEFLEPHLLINPGNHPLTMTLADALSESRAYHEAARVLEAHAKTRPHDHHVWYMLAEAQGQAGNTGKVHQARAEYFTLTGDFKRAREQWQYALRLATENSAPASGLARLRRKIAAVEEMEEEARKR